MPSSSSHTPERVTELLSLAGEGSRDAFQELFPIVYDELRRLASTLLSAENAGLTLQPTALVHEAYLKLLRQQSAGCKNRREFLGIAAQAMRRILVDHSRRKRADKRGGGDAHMVLEDAALIFEERAIDLLALDDALTRLREADERKAQMVELRFFAGLSLSEAADTVGVSARTGERDWRMARAWLRKELGG